MNRSGILAPFHQVAVEIFLRNEFLAAAGDAHDADALVDLVEFRLVLEAARIDVDLMAELCQFAGEFDDVDDLAAGIGGAERRIGGDVSVG